MGFGGEVRGEMKAASLVGAAASPRQAAESGRVLIGKATGNP